MNINDAFPSTWLKASDLKGHERKVIIADVSFEDIGGDHKLCLSFHGTEKKAVINKTNANRIAEMYGPETDDWRGKPIVLYPDRVEFQGKIVDAIRVKMQRMQPAVATLAAQPATAAAKPNGTHPDYIPDEIPF